MSDQGETLAPAERRARNRLIAAERVEGRSWKEIATHFRISERQARRAAEAAHRIAAEEGEFAGIDAEAILARIVRLHIRALDRLEAEMEKGDNSAARVGACRAASAAGAALRDSLAAAGLIASGDQIRIAAEAREVAKALLRVADNTGIPVDRVARELEEQMGWHLSATP